MNDKIEIKRIVPSKRELIVYCMILSIPFLAFASKIIGAFMGFIDQPSDWGGFVRTEASRWVGPVVALATLIVIIFSVKSILVIRDRWSDSHNE